MGELGVDAARATICGGLKVPAPLGGEEGEYIAAPAGGERYHTIKLESKYTYSIHHTLHILYVI